MEKRVVWLAGLVASGVSFLVSSLTPQLLDIWKHTDELSDSERDYVLRVIELQPKATPAQAQGIAGLTNVATQTYLRDEAFRKNFGDAVTSYALTVSGAAAAEQASQKSSAGEVPKSAGAAADLGRVQAASTIANSSPPGTTAQVVASSSRSRKRKIDPSRRPSMHSLPRCPA